ncbi:hypothetical protein T10_6190 [Trichinella papuae]|uniref:Uncharacterized protein n=1 Tax=Trichinella papuae TaxID=268474 RepID=A0A0V1M0P2_9BILA|nr:hypothetical protein T10_6190 [Trichinella papuae]
MLQILKRELYIPCKDFQQQNRDGSLWCVPLCQKLFKFLATSGPGDFNTKENDKLSTAAVVS